VSNDVRGLCCEILFHLIFETVRRPEKAEPGVDAESGKT